MLNKGIDLCRSRESMDEDEEAVQLKCISMFIINVIEDVKMGNLGF